MPPVFPSSLFPPGACGQVRPVGATLPTAARRAPSREAADGSHTWKHVIPGPPSPATGTGRSDTCVDRHRISRNQSRRALIFDPLGRRD